MKENYDEFSQLDETEKMDVSDTYQFGEKPFSPDTEVCDYYRVKVVVKNGDVRAFCYTTDYEYVDQTLRSEGVSFNHVEFMANDPVTYEKAHKWKLEMIRKADPATLTLQKRVNQALLQD